MTGRVVVTATYRVALARTRFAGESTRVAGVTEVRRIDQSHTGMLGAAIGF